MVHLLVGPLRSVGKTVKEVVALRRVRTQLRAPARSRTTHRSISLESMDAFDVLKSIEPFFGYIAADDAVLLETRLINAGHSERDETVTDGLPCRRIGCDRAFEHDVQFHLLLPQNVLTQ